MLKHRCDICWNSDVTYAETPLWHMLKQCWDICWNSVETTVSTFNFGWKISETETGWDLKFSNTLIESAMILWALIESFWCFAFSTTSSGSSTSSLINLHRSFSARIIPILYFQARKLSMPSSFSTSFVLADILYLELWKMTKNEKCSKSIFDLTRRCAWLRRVAWCTWIW